MAKKTIKQKKSVPAKTVKKAVKKSKPIKKTTVTKKEEVAVAETPAPKTEPVAETKKADFTADVATTVNKPATTITTVNTDRARRVISTKEAPETVNEAAELERIFKSTYSRANRSEIPEARHIEEWIKRLNPEAQVLIERPSKGVRIQASFTVTVGNTTRRMPSEGFWTTAG